MKKIKVVLLVVIMAISTSSVAFADVNESDEFMKKSISSGKMNIEKNIGNKEELLYEDFDNGDCRFILMENENVISEAYVDRDKRLVTYKNFRGETPICETEKISTKSYIVADMFAANYVNAGTVKYNLYSQGYVINSPSIKFDLKTEKIDGTTYDINGKYKDITTLASFVALTLSIPGAISSAVALKVLKYLGIIASVSNFVIPKYEIEANEVKNIWRVALKGSTEYKYFSGSKYTFNHKGKGQQTEKDADYYDLNSYKNKNSSLAYRGLYLIYRGGFDNAEIMSW